MPAFDDGARAAIEYDEGEDPPEPLLPLPASLAAPPRVTTRRGQNTASSEAAHSGRGEARVSTNVVVVVVGAAAAAAA